MLFTLLIKLKYRAEISAGKHAVSKSGGEREGERDGDLLKAKPPRQTEAATRAAAMSPAKRKKATEQKKKNKLNCCGHSMWYGGVVREGVG